MTAEHKNTPKIKIWAMAARPKTLPAAAAPVIVGAAVAFYDDLFMFVPVIAALFAALLLQIGANFANDVFDYRRGADTTERLGPVRVTQAGLLSPKEVLIGMWLVFGLAAIMGIYLIATAGWPVLIIGLAAILAAIAYTGGPYPLGYYGLGDVAVFVFFGPVAVCGTYYVQAGSVSSLAGWSSIPMGLLITAILVVNNLRDIETDRTAGKRTLAVRLGETGTRWEYLGLISAAYLIPPIINLIYQPIPWILLTWLSAWMMFQLVRIVWIEKGRPLNKALAQTGQLTLLFAILFGLGLIITRYTAI